MKRFSFGDQGEADGINMASTMLMLISHGGHGDREHLSAAAAGDRVFACKTCNRQFSSFQALGGHRASHKKPRLADGGNGQAPGPVGKPKVHECSICGVEFAIGQALGGHMRRHRGATHGHVDDAGLKSDGKKVGGFDLNLPPDDENVDCRKLGFVLDLGLGLGLGLEYVR